MAPSRKRKAAAAAAAARRQWKVGDLVLAKLKGFPAWPATVSEPEKWGFRPDWKKVLVLFFGTQQIAFCNPADVEAFTEEKKQSLLKRQGKGADFVRAVKEIIDSYEKSKKQDEGDGSDSGDVVPLLGGGNSAESSAHSELKEAVETSEATVAGKSVITTYTARRRSGGLQSRKQVNHQMEPEIDKFSLSSCSESLRRVQATFNDGSKYTGDALSDVMQNIRRNRQVRKSPDASEWDDVDSSAFVSSGSTEDKGSEIVPGDSDSCCIIDSDCKLDQSEAAVESLDGDAELSKGLDFQIKAIVIKKKRKPSRKRIATEASEPPTRLESESELEVGLHNDTKDLQIACEKFDKEYNKEDGDEHLPLVKRARVRMGKLQSLEEQNSSSQADEGTCKEVSANLQDQHNNSCEAEERNSNEAAINGLEQTDPSANVKHDCLADGSSFDVKEIPRCTVDTEVPDRHEISRTMESQTFGSSADGEAALPPSKRLHRALEAMSANVAEEGQPCADSITAQTLINSPVSSSMNPVSLSPESDKRDGSGEKSLDRNRARAFGSSSSMILEESIETPLEPDICNQAMESSPHKETCQEPVEYDDGKYLNEPCLETQAACAVIQVDSQVNFVHNLDGRQTNLPLNSVSSELLQKGEDKSDSAHRKNFGNKNLSRQLDTHKLSGESPNFISHVDEVGKAVSRNDIVLLQYSQADTAFTTFESLRSQINNSQADGECEMPKENQNDGRQKEASFVSMSEDQLVEEDVLGFQSSPFPADAIESPTRTSPTTTSQCHISTSESANDAHNSGCSSPSAQLHYKKSVCSSVDEEKVESGVSQPPKCAGKWGNCAEAHAALTSFEGVLGSLSRTKESIGRATRIAIDCAKFGVSSKVVEILARNLETECSLHRRVDLFFLVDSITQCSRGLKGDVGGVYPSAIQAALPRLLAAAAPPGSFAQENRRQCMKVLRLWLERRILPESVVRHHIQELDTLGGSSSAGVYSRRSARTERSLDDPVRDMEGMLVDEYGSNSSLQLVGLCLPRMLKDEDEGSDSDGGGFEAVTPEHYSGTTEEQETASPMRKHTRVLEDVDGELEMEDVAPSCDVENNSTSGSVGIDAALSLYSQSGQSFPLPFATLVRQGMPPSSPPLPSSPPPPPPPLPPTAPTSSLMPDPYANDCDLKSHVSSQNTQEDARPSTFQQSDLPRTHSSMSNGVQYPAPDCRDCMQMQFCESTSSSSNGYQVCQDYDDGPRVHHKAYHPIPPHPPPANQFSYMQPGQCGKSHRGSPPPPFFRRSWHNADGAHFNNNHERMRPAPYEFDESWRHRMPHFHGPHYPDRAKSFHPPIPYGGPSREPVRLPHRGWPYPPRGMHHRNFTPFRPSEAPSMWRPG